MKIYKVQVRHDDYEWCDVGGLNTFSTKADAEQWINECGFHEMVIVYGGEVLGFTNYEYRVKEV